MNKITLSKAPGLSSMVFVNNNASTFKYSNEFYSSLGFSSEQSLQNKAAEQSLQNKLQNKHCKLKETSFSECFHIFSLP